MTRRLAATLLLGVLQFPAQADNVAGLVSVVSRHDVATTTDKLIAALEEKGLSLFSRIDHAAGAAQAGMSLAPTQLVIFGSPKVGTALMNCGQTAGIDLPLKALIWQDAEGVVRLGYNSPDWLAGRHGLTGCEQVVAKVTDALAGLAEAATR